jgi:hypothetical protein
MLCATIALQFKMAEELPMLVCEETAVSADMILQRWTSVTGNPFARNPHSTYYLIQNHWLFL